MVHDKQIWSNMVYCVLFGEGNTLRVGREHNSLKTTKPCDSDKTRCKIETKGEIKQLIASELHANGPGVSWWICEQREKCIKFVSKNISGQNSIATKRTQGIIMRGFLIVWLMTITGKCDILKWKINVTAEVPSLLSIQNKCSIH